ncbi:MAG: hypothetical protein M1837_002621 [Sclerophora amabilis]|nr:MAG: hypothetical protein M1837_002621 [Sclerophora amabilis]
MPGRSAVRGIWQELARPVAVVKVDSCASSKAAIQDDDPRQGRADCSWKAEWHPRREVGPSRDGTAKVGGGKGVLSLKIHISVPEPSFINETADHPNRKGRPLRIRMGRVSRARADLVESESGLLWRFGALLHVSLVVVRDVSNMGSTIHISMANAEQHKKDGKPKFRHATGGKGENRRKQHAHRVPRAATAIRG